MLRLKSFFLLMILLWAGVSSAPAVPAFSELRQMASFSPKEVLVLADSLYDEVAYPHYKLDYIKACATSDCRCLLRHCIPQNMPIIPSR